MGKVIGIDLGVTAKHRAIIADERSQFISPIIRFASRLADLDRLRARALQGAEPDCTLVVVMEATNIVWYPVSVYFLRQGATVHVPRNPHCHILLIGQEAAHAPHVVHRVPDPRRRLAMATEPHYVRVGPLQRRGRVLIPKRA